MRTSAPEFAHMRPGYAWFDPVTRLLVVALTPRPCTPAGNSRHLVPAWNYTVPDFYGFRGEKPFYPEFQRSDYSGYRALKCLPLQVTTRADAPRPPRLRLAAPCNHVQWRRGRRSRLGRRRERRRRVCAAARGAADCSVS